MLGAAQFSLLDGGEFAVDLGFVAVAKPRFAFLFLFFLFFVLEGNVFADAGRFRGRATTAGRIRALGRGRHFPGAEIEDVLGGFLRVAVELV